MPTPEEAVRSYAAAWAESDEAARLRLLEQAWADDGTYTDPLTQVTGREALSAAIGQFMTQSPGVRIVQTTGVDTHHAVLRFGWKVEGATAPPLAGLEGFDFGELAEDGRLRRIVGFFGPFPSMEQPAVG